MNARILLLFNNFISTWQKNIQDTGYLETIVDIISRTRAYNVMCHLKPYYAEFYRVKRVSNFDLTPDNKAEAVVSI